MECGPCRHHRQSHFAVAPGTETVEPESGDNSTVRSTFAAPTDLADPPCLFQGYFDEGAQRTASAMTWPFVPLFEIVSADALPALKLPE